MSPFSIILLSAAIGSAILANPVSFVVLIVLAAAIEVFLAYDRGRYVNRP